MPRFSILIPAHNSESYIIKALSSIKKQTYKNYELIVVCDNCTDNTAKVAESYGAKVVEVNYNNDGLSRSRAIDEANGKWILFLDDDDWWLHEYVLEQINNKLKSLHDNLDILAFSFIFKGVCYASPLKNRGVHWTSVWNKCWKRSTIGETRFPNIFSISDHYFHNEMMSKNPKSST